MPAGQGKDAELFAAAVEQGAPPCHAGDGELARDLQIVAMLRSRGEAFAPHPDEKARARQRLMAMLAEQPEMRSGPPDDSDPPAAVTRIETAHGTGGAPTGRRAGRHNLPSGMSSRPVTRPRGSRRPASRSLHRRALVGAAALLAVVVTTGMGVFASRDALPGDNLYALKRVAESTGLALAFDEESKARRHLAVATTRIDEVEQMVGRSSHEPLDPDVVTANLREFDAATGEGSRILLTSDDLSGTSALQDLRVWAGDQSDRLIALRPALPKPAASKADAAVALLERLSGRTTTREQVSPCGEPTGDTADELGPLPAGARCAPQAGDPADPGKASHGVDESAPSQADPQPTVVPDGPGHDPAEGPTGGAAGRVDDGTRPGPPPEKAPSADLPSDVGSEQGKQDEQAPQATRTPRTAEPAEPAPLLPPVEVPPLVPGLPGVSLG